MEKVSVFRIFVNVWDYVHIPVQCFLQWILVIVGFLPFKLNREKLFGIFFLAFKKCVSFYSRCRRGRFEQSYRPLRLGCKKLYLDFFFCTHLWPLPFLGSTVKTRWGKFTKTGHFKRRSSSVILECHVESFPKPFPFTHQMLSMGEEPIKSIWKGGAKLGRLLGEHL